LTALPPIFPLFDPVQSVFTHWTSRDVKAANQGNADSFKPHYLEACSVVWVNQSLEPKREADARPIVGGRSVVVRIGRIVVRVIVVGAVVDVWPIVSTVAIAAMAISPSAFLRLIPISLPTRLGSS
jgi:hypothetical protein